MAVARSVESHLELVPRRSLLHRSSPPAVIDRGHYALIVGKGVTWRELGDDIGLSGTEPREDFLRDLTQYAFC
jgi:hypothetical protein